MLVILFVDVQFALDFQLIGGIIIIQVLPAVVFGLYTRWFRRWALLVGWAAGIAASTKRRKATTTQKRAIPQSGQCLQRQVRARRPSRVRRRPRPIRRTKPRATP